MRAFVAKYIRPWAKAHVAGLGAALSMLGADLAAGSVSTSQWEAAALVALGVGGAVAGVSNKPFSPAAVVPAALEIVQDVIQDSAAPVALAPAPAAIDVVQDSAPAPVEVPAAQETAPVVDVVQPAVLPMAN